MDDSPQFGSGDDDDSAVARRNEREAYLADLRAAVTLGLEDIKAGRVVDLDEAFDQVEAMLDELEAAKQSGA
jgi:predicted transcriptional regulator